jgi:hypothetical protein
MTLFIQAFRIALHHRLGREPRIYCDSVSPTAEPGLQTIKRSAALKFSIVFMPVITPGYTMSPFHTREVDAFIKMAGTDRVVKVMTDDTSFSPLEKHPSHIFWERVRDEIQVLDPNGDKFRDRLFELAGQVVLLLQGAEKSRPVLSPLTIPAINSPYRMEIFLCHSSGDKPSVRALYDRLSKDTFQPWLDAENLVPGQDWEQEIKNAISRAGVILVCLSKGSTTKEGFVQKEIRMVLDRADEMPEGTIFLIPARLEDCSVPERLQKYQWVNLFEEEGYRKLLQALHIRAKAIKDRSN